VLIACNREWGKVNGSDVGGAGGEAGASNGGAPADGPPLYLLNELLDDACEARCNRAMALRCPQPVASGEGGNAGSLPEPPEELDRVTPTQSPLVTSEDLIARDHCLTSCIEVAGMQTDTCGLEALSWFQCDATSELADWKCMSGRPIFPDECYERMIDYVTCTEFF
jgi:hypothetical protein